LFEATTIFVYDNRVEIVGGVASGFWEDFGWFREHLGEAWGWG